MQVKKVVILGGTGFIGDYLVKSILKNGKANLSVIYKNNPPQKKLPQINYVRIDGGKNGKVLGEIIRCIDCLIILTSPNIDLIKNVIKYSSKVKKIIYASTILLYSDSHKPQTESAKLKPINDYEKGKVIEEKLLKNFANLGKTKLTIARLTNVYGDIKNRGIIHKIFHSLINNEKFVINNDGNQIRDYIFVEDAAMYLAFLTFAKQNSKVEIFNICTSLVYSIKDLISEVEILSGKKLKIEKGLTVMEKINVIGDNIKIIKASNLKPKFSLELGLKKTYQNYFKNI